MMSRADAWRDSPATPERLAHINRLAADYYQACYPESWAQPYLAGRFGVDLTGHPDIQPGYAPAGWSNLVAHLHRHGVSDVEMLAAGVATTASTGRLIDRFRDRAVFPIIHEGVVLGFVGRRHPQRTDGELAGPKYLNTGDTPLFHKGDQLFTTGPWDAGATPVIVEGPMDAVAVTLATGGRFVGVAPLGTSMTDEQAAQLRALGFRTPIVATDADLAGRVAAERDFWILTPHGHDPLFAHFPDGTDPAELVARGQSARLIKSLANARPLGERLVDERFAHLTPAEAAMDAVRIVAAQPPDRWEAGAQHIADQLQVPASVIRAALTDMANAWNRDPRAAAQIPLRDASQIKSRLARDTHVTASVASRANGISGPDHERQRFAKPVQAPVRAIDR
jgi:DNA primase catalytic core